MEVKRRVIYHDFRKQPIPPVPEPPSGWWFAALMAVGVLALLLTFTMPAFGDVPPTCWAMTLDGKDTSYHYKERGDCERMRIAVTASACENIPAQPPQMNRALCYERATSKAKCVPVTDPSCESR